MKKYNNISIKKILLAAGYSKRYGDKNKLTENFKGKHLIQHITQRGILSIKVDNQLKSILYVRSKKQELLQEKIYMEVKNNGFFQIISKNRI